MAEYPEITPLKRFWLLLRPNRREIRQVYAFAILNGFIMLSLPLGIQSIINLIQGGQVSTSWIVLVAIVLLGISLSGLMQIMQLRITENLQQVIFTKAAFEFAYRVPRIKLKEMFEHYAPELMNRFFGTITVQKGLSKILIDFSLAAFQIILGLLLLSLYHPIFIALCILFIALAYLILKLTGKRGIDTSLEESKYKFQVAHWLEEVARANKTFKLAGDTDLHLRTADFYVEKYLDARERHFSVLRTQYIFMVIFKVLVAGLLLVIGGLLVINQQMNIGQFVAAELIILMLTGSVEKMILSLETIYDVLASLEKIGFVTDMELESEKSASAHLDPDKAPSVELNKLVFAYPDSTKKQLDEISLKINQGEKIMLAGKNGEGKTTLLHLLAGLYELDSGNICFNGLPIGNYNLSQLRTGIACCFADTPLFSGTLLENIRMGNARITVDEIMQLAELVGVAQTIKQLPKGLDTVLLTEDRNFSKSALIKIYLLRCFAARPKLLLVDDVLDIIELQERRKIIDFLTSPENKWTLVIASQDAYTAAKCERVCIIEKGKVKMFDRFENVKNEL